MISEDCSTETRLLCPLQGTQRLVNGERDPSALSFLRLCRDPMQALAVAFTHFFCFFWFLLLLSDPRHFR